MITVFGANGNTGNVVAKELLAKGKKVRVVARDASKVADLAALGADVVTGDVTDPGTASRALEGASAAYLLVPPDMSSPDLVGRAERIIDGYVKALDARPLSHVAFLSSVAAHEPKGTGPIVITNRAERAFSAIQATKFTFIRAAYFMENLLANAHPMKADGVLPVFGGGEGFPFPMIATKDIGKVAAASLASPPSATEIIELTGPRDYSFVDAAEEASKILGRKVVATPVPLDRMVDTLTSFGISKNVAGLFHEMTAALGTGFIKYDGKGRRVNGTTTLGEVLGVLAK